MVSNQTVDVVKCRREEPCNICLSKNNIYEIIIGYNNMNTCVRMCEKHLNMLYERIWDIQNVKDKKKS